MVAPAETVATSSPGRTGSPGNDAADAPAKAKRGSTRERILRTSLELFASRGFDGTDIVEIEEAVGLTPGSGGFYRHFKNKEDVLRAVVEAEIDRLEAYHHRLEALEPRPNAADEVRDRIDRLVDMMCELRDLMAVVAHDHVRFPDLLDTLAATMSYGGVAIGAADLQRLMDAGAIPRRPPQVVATILLMAAIGYMRTTALFGRPIGGVERDELASVLTALVLGTSID